MINKIKKPLIIILGIIGVIGNLAFTGSYMENIVPTPEPTKRAPQNISNQQDLNIKIEVLRKDIEYLKISLAENEKLIHMQEKIYDTTVKRYEITSNYLLTIITIIGILIAFLSIVFINQAIEKFVKDWLDKNAKNKLEITTSRITEDVQAKYNKELDELLKIYDGKFADLYGEIEKTFRKGSQE